MIVSRRYRRIIQYLLFIAVLAFFLFYNLTDRKNFHAKMSKIQIGMKTDSILIIVGKPDTIIQTNTKYGINSVWYYNTGYQESESYKLIIDQKMDTVLYINEP